MATAQQAGSVNEYAVTRVLSANTTNSTLIQAGGVSLRGWYVSNINAAPRYLKLYDKATAPTVGTDTPIMTILIPGNAAGAGANIEFKGGVWFNDGLGMGIVTGVADSDATAPAANEQIVHLMWSLRPGR